MIILVIFAFISGVVTILSPCILPILPIVLSGGVTSGKAKPWGIVTGFILSFTFFTLFLSGLVSLFGIPADILRVVSVILIGLFGLSLIIPQFQTWMEQLFSKLASRASQNSSKTGFAGGFVLGLSLGLIWTPCVGPILASVITVAATNTVNLASVWITLAYAAGTAIPMLGIIYGGRALLARVPWLTRNTLLIQKIFGGLLILVALAIYFNFDRQFQTYILDKFPQYGAGLTKLEDNDLVKQELGQRLDTELSEKIAPEIRSGGEWFNSQPLTLEQLRGRVVLVDFWTYTCINCIRTLPYLKAWDEKYRDLGLTIIGVHSPEFEFEKDAQNVAKAIADFGIQYPVVQDNDFATWRAYQNRYWPAKYLIDAQGRVRYTHYGEGEYDKTERMIQLLLSESGKSTDKPITNPDYQNYARTPETYLGYARIENFASTPSIKRGQTTDYTPVPTLPLHHVAFAGSWMITEEYSSPQTGSILSINFEARDVFLVMRTSDGRAGKASIRLDSEPMNDIVILDNRLYELIKLPTPGKHLLEIEFATDNVEVFAFTFG